MKAWVGTSGYSYKPWIGTFYPKSLHANEMLGFYAAKLKSVEINNTFYRFPKAALLQSWRKQVPADFRFVIKAPKKITHILRLKDAEKEVSDLCTSLTALGTSLGAVLFQLPPNQSKNLDRLSTFLSWLPSELPVTLEFRHKSWYDQDVYALLREHNHALCVSDTDEEADQDFPATANWGYLRLRREHYSHADLEKWKKRILAHEWEKVYVYFKHEDGGTGPVLAAEFEKMLSK